MNKTTFFSLWSGMFILCAGLGFIPDPTGVLKWLLFFFAIIFFAPPAMLVYHAARDNDRHTLTLVRNLSALSLGLTLLLLVCNFWSLMSPEALGNVLYILLVIVSAPMYCGQYWVLSLFLWACLLMVCLHFLSKSKK